MKTLKFKTTLKCNGCVQRVTPFLNEIKGISSWKADLQQPDSNLEVIVDGADEKQIIAAVEKAGYKIEQVS